MPKSYFNADAICPFYILSQNKPLCTISCEGIKGVRTVKLLFHNKIDKNEYMQDYCANDYKSCQIYRAVIEKYEEGKK